MGRSIRGAGRTCRRLMIGASLIALLLGTAPVTAADAASEPQGSAVATPTHVLTGAYPHGMALALDAAGHRHIAAVNRAGDLWYATDRSGTWVRQRVMRGGDPDWAWMAPSIAIDADGSVHIAVANCTTSETPGSCMGVWYVTNKGRAGGGFATAQRVAGSGMTDPSLKVVDGVLYLAYARCLCVPEQRSAPVFFKTDRGGTWHKELIAAYGLGPSLRVAGDGRARIAYKGPSGIRYTKAATRLGAFSTPVVVPGSAGAVSEPSLALDRDDRPNLAWVANVAGDSMVRFVRRSGAGWSGVTNVGPGVETELSLDVGGRPHLVIVAQGSKDRVIHRWLTAAGWQRTLLREAGDISSVAIRAYEARADIAWAQGSWGPTSPRQGVWVTRD